MNNSAGGSSSITGFEQTSSFTHRLRTVLIVIAVFFLLGVATSYVSSMDFLKGIQQINKINKIINSASLSIEGINTTEQNLDKIFNKTELKDVKFSFRETLKLTVDHLKQAISLSHDYPGPREELIQALESLSEYGETVTAALNRVKEKTIKVSDVRTSENDFSGDLLVAEQFALEASESIRSAQIALEIISGETFNNIYKNRFTPLIVAGILSLLFFTFVLVVGLATARRLVRNLGNLTAATDAVAQGDLGYQAPIIEQDEFGRLTFEFNQMVRSLRESRQDLNLVVERISTLQQLTASLSQALLPEQVFEVIFKQGFDVLGVKAGAVGLLDEEKKNIILQRIDFYAEDVQKEWGSFPLSSNTPMAEAIRSGEAIFIETLKELKSRYPHLMNIFASSGVHSFVSLPLFAGGEIMGSIMLNFGEDRNFDEAERNFLLALARQCSQSLHRTQLFAAAREAVKIRDEFLSIASHELRTPLTPLKLQLQSLSRQVKKGNIAAIPTEQIMKTVESSDRQVNRLTSLIDDLLDVSRISSGKLSLNREPFDLAGMIDEVVAQFTHHFKETNSQILIEAENNIVASLDKVRIEQVFINLLTNAAKYAPGKPIHVSLKEIDNKAILSVQDEGQGIADADRKRIFERFERVRDRDNIGGLGLGLYISRQIIEAHGGTIWVESEPGKGAKFVVKIPLSEGKGDA